ncbi:hypothetical protein [Olivibacter domesticus]|uniref:Uncharacterized protein n=1 Tax=Olivibacter domesticus TaxID=407022 RepID=A0A1H7JTX1_OLID1|nr:hypothetical protein [Olivibacter domesticus]SEK77197.1 hypothetical protein SAMN05661044_01106 [Olivibacter domesticus]
MKTKLTFLGVISPFISFAQMGGGGGGREIISVLIVLAITIGLLLLLRSVMLWYWKVDTALKNQVETNRLLGYIAGKLEDIERKLGNKGE